MGDAKTQHQYQSYFGQYMKQLITHVDAQDTYKFWKTFDKLLNYLSKRPAFSPKIGKMETLEKIDQFVEDHQMAIPGEKFKAYKKFAHSLKTATQSNKPNNPQLKILLAKINKLRKKQSHREVCFCNQPFLSYSPFYFHVKNDHKELYIRIPDEELEDIDEDQMMETDDDDIIVLSQTKHSDHQNITPQHQSQHSLLYY